MQKLKDNIHSEGETSAIMAWPNRATGAIAHFIPFCHCGRQPTQHLGCLRKLQQQDFHGVFCDVGPLKVQSALQCTTTNMAKWKGNVYFISVGCNVALLHMSTSKPSFYWLERKKSEPNFTTEWLWMVPGSLSFIKPLLHKWTGITLKLFRDKTNHLCTSCKSWWRAVIVVNI